MPRTVTGGTEPRLAREMGLAGLTATGVCSMVGAGINVIPFMIQRNVPGIGPFVLEAFAFAALPAVLAAIAYAILASAMPRARGSYVYVSRGLDPYLGFVASVLQWVSLSVPIAAAAGWPGAWTFLSASAVLCASFIGFDSIARAGGEAKNPSRNLPLAIGLAVGSVGVLYMLFTAAVYHAVPWQYIAEEAQRRDLTVPGLLGYLLPPFWTVIIISAAAVAL